MKTIKAALGIGVRRAGQRKQTGVATILVILMVGVGLVAVSVGTMHTMRNSQERQLVAHSQINAQAGAWAAVEAVRQLLGTLTAEQLAGLEYDREWAISGTDGFTQKAVIKNVTPPASASVTDYKIKAEVSAVADAGQSSSTIEVFYLVTPGAGSGVTNLNGVLDFYNDLSLSGGLKLDAGGKEGLSFNVDGDLTADSIGVSGGGLKNISVTGNVALGSDVAAEVVRGRNIKLTGGSKAKTLEAWGLPAGEPGSQGTYASKNKGDNCCGEIETSGGVFVDKANANGPVKAGSNGIEIINTRRTVSIISSGSYSEINAVRDVTIGASVEKATLVNTGGNFSFTADNIPNPMLVRAVGDAKCSKENPGSPPRHTIKAKGTIDANCKGSKDLTITAPIIDKVAEVTLIQPKVDAWALKSAANYAIEFEGKKLKVTVKNVNNIPDGFYYLGRLAEGSREYLCRSVDDSRKCLSTSSSSSTSSAAASAIPVPFCFGGTDVYNPSCFTPDFTNKKLTIKADIKPSAMPPGVIWINGDLELAGGPFFNTFIATKSISTSGDATVYSVNYAADYKLDGSADAACKNQRDSSTFTEYNNLYPTNFCSSDKKFTPLPIGNIALLAGGINPDVTPKAFTGGEITLNSKNVIHGTVVAGNLLRTNGSTTVYGYISAAGLRDETDVKNALSQGTTVDLSKLPSTFTPGVIPGPGGGSGGSSTAKSEVLWSRYL